MKTPKYPFNIALFNNREQAVGGLLPVQSLTMYDDNGGFHPQGLYSTVIFGEVGTDKRNEQFSFIPLNVWVMQPHYAKQLIKLKALYGEILNGRTMAKWDDEIKDFVKSDVLDGETGYGFFMQHFFDIKFQRDEANPVSNRNQLIDLLEKYRSTALCDYMLVLPAGLRDVVISSEGRPEEDGINPLYRSLMAVNATIKKTKVNDNNPIYDGARANTQRIVIDVFDYIYNIVEGKKGFIMGKYGSRRIVGSTRNVLSSMEMGGAELGDPSQPTLDTTMVGTLQFIKACEPLMLYQLKNGPFANVISAETNAVELVDSQTLKSIPVELSAKSRDKWQTNDGIISSMNAFKEEHLRHKPVMIDGCYLGLMYMDGKTYRPMLSIDELPDSKSKDHVRPITWAELWYIHAVKLVKRVRCFDTRYPVDGLKSIYPNYVMLKSTVKGLRLQELNIQWVEGDTVLEFPDSVNQLPFFNSMAVHANAMQGLGADVDGDLLNFTLVWSDESVKEIDDYLNDPTTYVDSNGQLMMPPTTTVTDWVLSHLTRV